MDDKYVKALPGYKGYIETIQKAKKTGAVKAAIREAIGQLLEYNHYPNHNKADKLIIVTAHEPEQEDMQYLMGLRTIYHIPMYYQQFNRKTKQLSKEY